MCAHQCMNFEREEYAKHRTCYENENLENKSLTKVWKHTTEPSKKSERIRLYEFCVKMFYNTRNNNVTGIEESVIENVYKNLSSKLDSKESKCNSNNSIESSPDDLGNCVKYLFSITSNTNEEKDIENEDIIIEELTDDHVDPLGTNTNNVHSNSNENVNSKIHPLALLDAIKEGNKKLSTMNLGQIRTRLHKRNKRFEKCQDKIYRNVIDLEQNVDNKISKLKNLVVSVSAPGFRKRYKLLKN